MSVYDASVLVDALVSKGSAGQDARRWLTDVAELQVPGVFVAEVMSALRSMLMRGDLSDDVATGALSDLKSLRLTEFTIQPFVDRAWELRSNLTIYDAWYVALAEALGTDLVTADHRLAKSPGSKCAIHHTSHSV